MQFSQKIAPCLWFDSEGEEAANFYVGIFKNSRITSISRYGKAGQETHKRPEGSVLMVAFELEGLPFTALNGGPLFKFSEAISLQIFVDDQKEFDYYWDRLIRNGSLLGAFRELFGDDTLDYDQAVQRHYEQGPPANWADSHISAYATMHPWEDWAETWAHYLHMVDTLETAKSHGLSLRVPGAERSGEQMSTDALAFRDFESLTSSWNSVTPPVANVFGLVWFAFTSITPGSSAASSVCGSVPVAVVMSSPRNPWMPSTVDQSSSAPRKSRVQGSANGSV